MPKCLLRQHHLPPTSRSPNSYGPLHRHRPHSGATRRCRLAPCKPTPIAPTNARTDSSRVSPTYERNPHSGTIRPIPRKPGRQRRYTSDGAEPTPASTRHTHARLNSRQRASSYASIQPRATATTANYPTKIIILHSPSPQTPPQMRCFFAYISVRFAKVAIFS